ncbi:MAG: amidohydrolase family protein [Thermoplasmata archaeon]|nr:amidohydrolase family protein [Thermoplasmata archaeon]MCI4359848.1 amidohydrolase family protein [Thermoplasmata archaeon]
MLDAVLPLVASPIVFRDALIVTQDASRRVERGDVRVDGGRFTSVGGRAEPEGAEVIDAKGFALLPGFINTHGHVAMTLLRGIADDRELSGFLETLFAVDARRTESDVQAGALAGIAEMLLSGTTAFLDLYYFEDAVARACERLGIRGFLGWAVLDPELTTQSGKPLDNARGFIDRWARHDRVTPLVAPQGVYVCGQETWLGAKALAEEKRTLCHFHLSETRKEVHDHEAKTGARPPVWLDEIGFLGPSMVAAHAVWMSKREVEILAKRQVGVAHCPSSNLKLATGGIAPVVEMRAAGVHVGLGTDSAASNNSLSMLREMHIAGLTQKNQRWDASALKAQELLDLATVEGAQLLGRANDLGSIEVGKQADLSMVRLDHPTLLPARPEALVSHLAYSASEEAIDSVFVAGECLVRHRALVKVPWQTVRLEAEAAARPLWERP